jgi:hypothetical protein
MPSNAFIEFCSLLSNACGTRHSPIPTRPRGEVRAGVGGEPHRLFDPRPSLAVKSVTDVVTDQANGIT